MKGITPVIAIILLLLITISMVGFAFMWFTRMASTAAESGTSQLNQTLGSMAQKISIINSNNTDITLRSTGTQSIPSSSVAFFVDGTQKGCFSGGSFSFNMAAGSIVTCKLCDELSGGTCTGSPCATGKKAKINAPGNSDEIVCP